MSRSLPKIINDRPTTRTPGRLATIGHALGNRASRKARAAAPFFRTGGQFMSLRKLALCSAVAVAILAGVASARTAGRYSYTHPKLGFSLEYSTELTAIDFPNGVELTNDTMQTQDRVKIFFTKILTEDKNLPNREPAYFDRFRAAAPGEKLRLSELGRGTYVKVANLKIDGHPGVRVVYEPAPPARPAPMTSGDVGCMPIPDFYVVSVYIRKDGEVWQLMNFSLEEAGVKAGAKTFEEVLRTLKFQPNRAEVYQPRRRT